jgi:hypothetical protein
MVRVVEDKILKFLEVHFTITVVVNLLKNLGRKLLLHRHLQLCEHLLKFIKGELIIFVDVEFVEDLFKDKLLMRSFSPLDEFESKKPDCRLNILNSDLFSLDIGHFPMRTRKLQEYFIVGYIQAEITVETYKLLTYNPSLGGQWHKVEQLFSNSLSAFEAKFKLFYF